MTAPTELGARTWQAPEDPGVEASVRTQVAVAGAVSSAIAIASFPEPATAGWGFAIIVALLAGIGVGLAIPPLAIFRRISGFLAAVVTVVGLTFTFLVLWSLAGVGPPFALVLLAGAFVLGLDWRRADRLRPLVVASFALVLLGALSERPEAIAAAVGWLALAFGTFTLIEADRRASLPRVQPDARSGAARARPDDLLTTLLVAAAIALLAAMVLGVPSCQRRLDGGPSPELGDLAGPGAGELGGGGGGAGGGSGSGGSGSGGGSRDSRYVEDPDGRFLIPDDGSGRPPSGDPGDLPPSPESVPQLDPGEELNDRDDGWSSYYEGLEGGGTAVTRRGPDGEVTRWEIRPRSDGLVQIDRLDEDGEVDRTYYYDPDGVAVEGEPGADPGDLPEPESAPDEPRDWSGVLRIAGVVLLVAALAGLAAWWWSRRRPQPAEVHEGVPPWAVELARRIDADGRERGRARASDESVVAYGRALAAERVPDARVTAVTEVVSDALFSGRDPGPEVQAWAVRTWDDVVVEHPVPDRRGRGEKVSSS